MGVFEYRGILVTSGKPTKGYRDAENAKTLRSAARVLEPTASTPITQFHGLSLLKSGSRLPRS